MQIYRGHPFLRILQCVINLPLASYVCNPYATVKLIYFLLNLSRSQISRIKAGLGMELSTDLPFCKINLIYLIFNLISFVWHWRKTTLHIFKPLNNFLTDNNKLCGACFQRKLVAQKRVFNFQHAHSMLTIFLSILRTLNT